MPDSPDGYKINAPETLKAFTGNLDTDPAVKTLREFYKEGGRSQGEFDNLFEALGHLADKGLISKPLDFAAERAALGENAAGRQAELETWAKGLKARGQLDDQEFGEVMSLTPTAAGVRALEKLRAMSNQTAGGPVPPAGDVPAPDAAKEEARAMARDPKYGKDRNFTRAADAKWIEAYGDKPAA